MYDSVSTTGWHIRLWRTSRWYQNKSSVLAWPGQDRPGQNGTFVFKSTGGLSQPDVSPCTLDPLTNITLVLSADWRVQSKIGTCRATLLVSLLRNFISLPQLLSVTLEKPHGSESMTLLWFLGSSHGFANSASSHLQIPHFELFLNSYRRGLLC